VLSYGLAAVRALIALIALLCRSFVFVSWILKLNP
jgi:hypothetical protein